MREMTQKAETSQQLQTVSILTRHRVREDDEYYRQVECENMKREN